MAEIVSRTIEDSRVVTVSVSEVPLLADARFVGPMIAVDVMTVRAHRRLGWPWRIESVEVEGEKVSASTFQPLGLRTRRVFSGGEAVGMYWLSAHAPQWLHELADRALREDVEVRHA